MTVLVTMNILSGSDGSCVRQTLNQLLKPDALLSPCETYVYPSPSCYSLQFALYVISCAERVCYCASLCRCVQQKRKTTKKRLTEHGMNMCYGEPYRNNYISVIFDLDL